MAYSNSLITFMAMFQLRLTEILLFTWIWIFLHINGKIVFVFYLMSILQPNKISKTVLYKDILVCIMARNVR